MKQAQKQKHPVCEKGADRISIDIDEKRLDRPYFLFPVK